MAFGGLFDSSQTQESESSFTPWWPTVAPLAYGVRQIRDWMKEPLEFYPEQTYAGQTPDEAAAIEALQAGAAAYPGMHANVYDPTMGAFGGALASPEAALGMGLQDVMSNPAVAGMADAIQSQVNRNLQENIMPQLRVNQIRGPAGDVAQGIAARGTQDVLAERLANMYGNAWAQGLGAETARYTAGLGAQQAAMGMAPGMAEMALSQYTRPAALLGQAGGLQRAEEQRAIDEDIARFEFEQMEPYNRATMGMGAIMAPAQAFGTGQTTSEVQTSPSAWSSIGNILSTAGSLGGLFGGMGGGGFGGLGGVPGAGGMAQIPYSGGFGMYNNPWTFGGYSGNPYDQQQWGIFR